jgi:hypothetical protein
VRDPNRYQLPMTRTSPRPAQGRTFQRANAALTDRVKTSTPRRRPGSVSDPATLGYGRDSLNQVRTTKLFQYRLECHMHRTHDSAHDRVLHRTDRE